MTTKQYEQLRKLTAMAERDGAMPLSAQPEQPQGIIAAGFTYHSDTDTVSAFVEWSDGSSTKGSPDSRHMKALLARAKREGKLEDDHALVQPELPQGEQALRERLREGNIRHLARRSGATWIKGLDGFAISEQDLEKLLDERDQARAEVAELLSALQVTAYELAEALAGASRPNAFKYAIEQAKAAIESAEKGN